VSAKRFFGRATRLVVGKRAYHTYIRPLRHHGRKKAYDPKSYYDNRYAVARETGEFTDATAMKPGHNPLRTRYHYNACENAIIEALLALPPPEGFSALDVGSGAGHWIAFYRDELGAGSVLGVEISTPAVEGLRERFPGDDGVEVVDADVSAEGFSLGRRFDVVNAVGTLYHVVDDELWRRAIANLAAHLEPAGRLVVGEQFTKVALDAGFHRTDSFSSWEEERGTKPERMLVGKRLRPVRTWKGAAEAAGLKLAASVPVRTSRDILTPVTRVLVFRKR
jgi:SAM-dependent methyltransferase